MTIDVSSPEIQQIIQLPEADRDWRDDLQRFLQGDVTLTRRSAGEAAIMAVQRLLIFLGHSTTAGGAFAIDGDFGRGTNRAVAQFQYEHGLTKDLMRDTLCYDCNWQNASRRIVRIPDVRLTVATLQRMLEVALQTIGGRQVLCGDFREAVDHLNALHRRQRLTCRQILARYGDLADQAARRIGEERSVAVRPEWILTIIKQETGGVVRPRFEQHLLSRYNRESPETDLTELRYRAMSMGLGQILGINARRVGAASARALYSSPLADQVLFVARFIAARPEAVSKAGPSRDDFRSLARYYNGPGYYRHRYDESIARWFREFRSLM